MCIFILSGQGQKRKSIRKVTRPAQFPAGLLAQLAGDYDKRKILMRQ